MSNENPSVLIVDDVMENIQVVVSHLRGEEYDLRFATDGQQALESLAAGPVDLILLDVMMPEIDGFEVCRRVKADPRLKDIPVVFLTAKTDPESLLRGFQSGGVDYITKPFNPDELLARVRTHLRLHRTERDLRGLLASRDRFLSIVAQDLRTPFSGLKGILKLLARDNAALPPEELADYLQMADAAAQGIDGLLENLLSWSQLQTGVFGFAPRPLAVSALFDDALLLEAGELRAKGIEVTVDADPALTIYADPEMAQLTLSRLLDNAIKFSYRNGKVELSAKRSEGGVKLVVADQGVGITGQDRERLFCPEMPLRRPGTEGEIGIGMGLPLAKAFTEQHGGHLEITSPQGGGTTVEALFPSEQARS